ncbi:hypothetical protein NE237_030033 [Protea cynaroides]|uniref:Protein transport protein Sec61 subunit beta n=1 Tax=Protea cynaroides TaxID=273540 RepID=A0A9Q0GUB0_9MAGN|nr:hypothetical protein NE237_030033 [Protea cynaroides]
MGSMYTRPVILPLWGVGGFRCSVKPAWGNALHSRNHVVGAYAQTTRSNSKLGPGKPRQIDREWSQMVQLLLEAAARGSAAAAASLRRRRTTGGGTASGANGTMLQFYTDDASGLKISPTVVLIMSIGFIAFVAILHVIGKFYLVPREAGKS